MWILSGLFLCSQATQMMCTYSMHWVPVLSDVTVLQIRQFFEKCSGGGMMVWQNYQLWKRALAGDSERSKVGARMLLRHSYTTDHPIRLGVSEGSEVVNLEALMLLLKMVSRMWKMKMMLQAGIPEQRLYERQQCSWRKTRSRWIILTIIIKMCIF